MEDQSHGASEFKQEDEATARNPNSAGHFSAALGRPTRNESSSPEWRKAGYALWAATCRRYPAPSPASEATDAQTASYPSYG